MLRKSLTLVGIVLAVFHIWLFAGQVWDGALADLALVSRWIIALGLVAALLSLHRRGLSMVAGRQPVAIWLLAALLHGPALARDLDVVTPAMPEVVATVAQVTASLAGLTTLVLFGLALLRRRPRPIFLALSRFDTPVFAGALPPGSFLRFAPRPPPIAK